MIIFESLLTAFEASSIFEAAGVEARMGRSLRPNHHNKIKLPLDQCFSTGGSRPTFGSQVLTFGSPSRNRVYMGRQIVLHTVSWVANYQMLRTTALDELLCLKWTASFI